MFVDLYWKTDVASPEFIADVIVQGKNPKPSVRDAHLKVVGGDPTFVVMRTRKIQLGYEGGHPTHKSGTSVYNFVLMDGSFVCFSARLNSGLTSQLDGHTLHPGSSITVKDHAFIWMWSEKVCEYRCVMLIKKFSWEQGPVIDHEDHPEAVASSSFCCDDFQKDQFDFETMDRVEKRQDIVFLNYKMTDHAGGDPTWVWTFMTLSDVKKGYWIRHDETRRLFLGELFRQKRHFEREDSDSDDLVCNCVQHYDLQKCVLDMCPLSRCCRKDVYDQVFHRLGGNVEGESFDDLKQNHKRWAMHWYYAVNVFGFHGKKRERKQLPTCFVQCVRNYYPDPVGVCYTGFKSHSLA